MSPHKIKMTNVMLANNYKSTHFYKIVDRQFCYSTTLENAKKENLSHDWWIILKSWHITPKGDRSFWEKFVLESQNDTQNSPAVKSFFGLGTQGIRNSNIAFQPFLLFSKGWGTAFILNSICGLILPNHTGLNVELGRWIGKGCSSVLWIRSSPRGVLKLAPAWWR